MKKLLYFGFLLTILTGTIQAGITVQAYSYCDTSGSLPGANKGTAGAYASGGTAPISYKWSNGGTAATIYSLSNGTYTLTVTDAQGSAAITSVVVKCNTTVTGINNKLSKVTGLNVYPNPAINTINISYVLSVTSSMVNLEVYDMLGNKVTGLENQLKQNGEYHDHFDVAQLNAGIYLVKLNVDGEVSTKRIIIQK